MLDYTLVTSKATYRMLTPRDMPAFVRLVASYYREELPGVVFTSEHLTATLVELGRDKSKGSMIVFEAEQALVGYCLLINYWSNHLGGTILCVDELYVKPEYRRHGIADDFLDLLAKVAPAGSVAIQLAVKRADKTAYKKLGFAEGGSSLMIRGIERR